MHLDRLTKTQVKIANKIWSIESLEEYRFYINSLPPNLKQEAVTIMELLLLASTDETIDTMTEYPLAEKMLNEIKR